MTDITAYEIVQTDAELAERDGWVLSVLKAAGVIRPSSLTDAELAERQEWIDQPGQHRPR